jgi:hypothetical protein
MALRFPINPTVGQLYQTGSSATYKYTIDGYWEIISPTTLNTLNAKLFDGSSKDSFITTSSLGLTQTITGSLVISQSLTVLGNTSITTITASNLNVGTNIVSVFANSPAILTGGYRVVDSASLSTSSSLLYNVSQSRWTIDRPLSGTFSGSLFGTASNALSASWLPLSAGTGIIINQVSGSYIISSSTSGSGGSGFPFSGSAIITGSLLVSGSQTVTGSLRITGSLLLNGTPVGSATVLVSGSAPSGSNSSGSLWWNTEDGNLYIQSTILSGSSWVPAVSSVAGGNFGATFRNSYSASVWTVNHNLGTTEPIVQIYSGSQIMIPASIVSLNAATSIITFAGIVSGSVVASTGVGGITSASYALTTPQATSASYALNATSASFSLSSSFALSSSFSVSSSRTLSSSFALFAHSASFASASNSASFAISSSRTLSSSFATNAVTASTNTLAYASIGISAIPAASNSDMTPTILNGNGITVSGNTIVIERPGVYLMNASIGIRATFAEYAWVDASNNRLAGTNTGLATSANSSDPAAPVSAMGIVNITSPNTVIKLRIFVGAAFLTQNTAYAVATITQLR